MNRKLRSNKSGPEVGNAGNYRGLDRGSYHRSYENYSYQRDYGVSERGIQRDYRRGFASHRQHGNYRGNRGRSSGSLTKRGKYPNNHYEVCTRRSAKAQAEAQPPPQPLLASRQSRPTSPVEGSEEYMTRKIQHTSALIMRHLLTPSEPLLNDSTVGTKEQSSVDTRVDNANRKDDTNDGSDTNLQSSTRRTKSMNATAQQIYEKIFNHIVKLNEGRKRNFVNAQNNTNWDQVISQMQKQHRLEISRILRDMNTTENTTLQSENGGSSIVADIGIKMEELPPDVIEQLRQTLNLDLENLNREIDFSSNPKVSDEIVSISSYEPDVSGVHVTADYPEGNASIPECEVGEDNSKRTNIQNEHISRILKPTSLQPTVNVIPIHETVDRDEANSSPDTYEIEYNKMPTLPRVVGTTIKQEPNEIEIKIEDLCDNLESPEKANELTYTDAHAESEHTELKKQSFSKILDSRIFSAETLCLNDNIPRSETSGESNTDQAERGISTSICDFPDVSFPEISLIKNLIEREKQIECPDLSTLEKKCDLIDECVQLMSNFKRDLMKSFYLRHNSRSSDIGGTLAGEKSVVRSLSQSVGTSTSEDKRVLKKRKVEDSPEIKEEDFEESILNISQFDQKITAIEQINDEVALGTEAGDMHILSLRTGTINEHVDVSRSTVTSMKCVKGLATFVYIYIGGLDGVLRIYDFRLRRHLQSHLIRNKILCMDLAWDYVFLGCKNGSLVRFGCKKGKVEFEEQTGREILVIKASQEGPRQVLLVGHRNAPIFIRDAFSGLLLRRFSDDAVTPTVYSLVLHKSLIYCGTAKDNVLVFSFHEGKLMKNIVADKLKGVCCMKIHKNSLFVGCYNGSVYVYNLDSNKLEATLKGTGRSIATIHVLTKQVIVGTLVGGIESLPFPTNLSL